jgi:2-haloacid dehalogenase
MQALPAGPSGRVGHVAAVARYARALPPPSPASRLGEQGVPVPVVQLAPAGGATATRLTPDRAGAILTASRPQRRLRHGALGIPLAARVSPRQVISPPGKEPALQPHPSVIVFDVNETLSDMAPLARRFAEVGAPELLARVWFASLLRDGFALAATGDTETFTRLGAGVLPAMLAGAALNRPASDAVGYILAGVAELGVHPDVPEGVRILRQHGLRLVTLSNGSAQVAERLLATAGIRGEFEQLLSAEDAGAWKPLRAAYAYAARACSVGIEDMLLVAVHPWDIHGAHQAGMRTGWVSRQPVPYPGYFAAPSLRAPGLVALAGQIVT